MNLQQNDATQTLFGYLARRDMTVEPGDLIIGFGHFDPKIPLRCGALWRAGLAPRILFTGGFGAGTADLGRPEALYFRDVILQHYPEMPASSILVEPASRHTGENVEKSTALLRAVSPEACFDRGIRHVILVATAARQRRVWLTCQKHWPHIRLTNAPPVTSLETERRLFAGKGRDLVPLLLGEMARILDYPERGFIVSDTVPGDVLEAYTLLHDGASL